MVGGVPAHGLSGQVQPKPSCDSVAAEGFGAEDPQLGPLVGIHLWKTPGCEKRNFVDIQCWIAAQRALICVENNAGALHFSLILV